MDRQHKVLALSGGVGGAKLALGLAQVLEPGQLTIVANTGDDFDHLGLTICPDLDTVMYTLAGRSNRSQGWGLEGESWRVMEALEALGGETWFRLGDLDLATHLARSHWLRQGESLSAVTARLCERLGVRHEVLPMTDQPVRTLVATGIGEMPFQQYFVRERCEPAVSGFRFEGLDNARPQPRFMQLLRDPALAAVVICPSNPFVSVEPILQLPGLREALKQQRAPVIAVSPIVGGAALKGPAAKMMTELQLPVTAEAVAHYYGDLLDGFVIDQADAEQAPAIEHRGVATLVVPTVMRSLEDKIDLARRVLNFAEHGRAD